jgi:hypothetical protein
MELAKSNDMIRISQPLLFISLIVRGGCEMGLKKDLTGERFHYLTVLGRASSNRQGSITWNCLCDCGGEKVISSDHLTRKVAPVKSCGCQAVKRGQRHSQWTGYEEISGNWFYNHILRERKQKDRTRVPVDLTPKDIWELFIKQDRKCALSGLPLKISNSHHYNDASVDRIDSSKGYTIDNVQWVHKHINFMKRTYSQEYFIEMCKKVAKNNDDI